MSVYESLKKIVTKNGDVMISDNYYNYDIKLDIKCGRCDQQYSMRVDGIRNGNRCKKCSYGDMASKRRISYNDVIEYIEKTGEKMMSKEYKNNKTPLEIICQHCQQTYKRPFYKVKMGYRCTYCFPKKKTTYEEVKDYIKTRGDILVASEVPNVSTPIQIQCGRCDKINMVRFHDYKTNGQRCNACNIASKRHTVEHIKETFAKNGDLLITKNYLNQLTNLDVECGSCNGVYQISYRNYVDSTNFHVNCWYCSFFDNAGQQQYDIEKIRKIFLSQGDILLSNEYKGYRSKNLRFRCHRCEKEHEISLNHYKIGYRCDGNKSRGEIRVEEYLQKQGIYFKCQKSFPDCINILPLRFDFWVKYQGISFCIEYNGGQHYKAVSLFGGEEGFRETIKRDNIKKVYCFEKNIPLLIIPYWDYYSIPKIILAFIEDLVKNKTKYSPIPPTIKLSISKSTPDPPKIKLSNNKMLPIPPKIKLSCIKSC